MNICLSRGEVILQPQGMSERKSGILTSTCTSMAIECSDWLFIDCYCLQFAAADLQWDEKYVDLILTASNLR